MKRGKTPGGLPESVQIHSSGEGDDRLMDGHQPEGEPGTGAETEEVMNSRRFRAESHVSAMKRLQKSSLTCLFTFCQSESFYNKSVIGFKPKDEGHLYKEKVPHNDGIYSGYMLDGEAHGPGTWVNPDATKRMEGIWSHGHFCVGIGSVEFNDGTTQRGSFVNGKYKPQVSRDAE